MTLRPGHFCVVAEFFFAKENNAPPEPQLAINVAALRPQSGLLISGQERTIGNGTDFRSWHVNLLSKRIEANMPILTKELLKRKKEIIVLWFGWKRIRLAYSRLSLPKTSRVKRRSNDQ